LGNQGARPTIALSEAGLSEKLKHPYIISYVLNSNVNYGICMLCNVLKMDRFVEDNRDDVFVHMGEAPLFIHIKYKHKNSKHRNRNTIILPVPTSGNRYRFP
jgi:diphthamide synthase subunit DPH2